MTKGTAYRLVASVLLAQLHVFGAGRALGQDTTTPETPARVALHLTACPSAPLEVPRFVDLLRIELLSDGVGEVLVSESRSPVTAHIEVAAVPCEPESLRFLVTIDDEATNKRIQRAFDLSDAPPDGRARMLALAVAELLRASWAELLIDDVDPPGEAGLSEGSLNAITRRLVARAREELGQPEASQAPPPPAATWSLDGAVLARIFPDTGAAPIGGRVGLTIPLGQTPAVALRVDADVSFATSLHPLGAVDLGLAAGGVSVLFAARLGPAQIVFGPRLEAGYGWTNGRPYETSTRAGRGGAALLVAALTAALRVELATRFWVFLGLDIGGTLLGLDSLVSGDPVTGLRGSMVSVRLGLAIEP